jgi:hypothetical protein
MNSVEQPSIRHLIVKRRLIDENEISIIHHQYPHVKYFELLFPLREERFFCCLKTLFNINDQNEQHSYWNKLIHFRTIYTYEQTIIFDKEQFYDWLISNTDLKFHSNSFIVNTSYSILSIWL